MHVARSITLATVVVVALALGAACGGGSGDKKQSEGPPPQSGIEGATQTAGGSAEANTVEVTALSFREDPREGPIGSAHTARVTVRPSSTGELKVSFAESEVGGIGAMWKSAGWTAVALSSLLLGVDPRKYEFTIDPGSGYIDGPSAGGLTTIGVLAAILGDDVRDDAAMTGTINPDGSIGPVGGIPQKLEGAAEAGKTLVLVPGSQHFDTDLKTGQTVDLVAFGEKLDIKVQPVTTVYEAYEILTGSPLPRPSGTGTAQLPPDAFNKLKASAIELLSRYDAAVSRFAALPNTFGYDEMMIAAGDTADEANMALKQGLAAVAYERAFTAAATAETVVLAANLATGYLLGGIDTLLAELESLASVESRLYATTERLAAEPARSATAVLALADAYSNTGIAIGLVQSANSLAQLFGEVDLTEEDALGLVFEIAANYSEADFYLDAAANAITYGFGFGESAPPDDALVTAIAETVRRAADANMSMLDSLVFQGEADSAGATLDEVKGYFYSNDHDYATALHASKGTLYFSETLKDESQRSVAVLGASMAAWSESAALVGKYYSLRAIIDPDFNVIGYGRERSVSDMLDLAADRAEELLGLVSEEEPVAALYYHENARAYREGDQGNKLDALVYNWQAAILAEALAYFNGTFDGAISTTDPSGLWRWGAASDTGGASAQE